MTAQDIARQAGVSVATVYRVMGGHPSASPAAVQRVDRALAELEALTPGDRYQRRRRPACRGGAGEVALMLVGQPHSADLRLARGVETVLAAEGLRLLFTHTPSLARLPSVVRDRRVDGLLLCGWGYGGPDAESLRLLAGLPSVWIGTHQSDFGDCVQPDNRLIGRAAARWLLAHGARRLAVIGPEANHLEFVPRAAAFVGECVAAGVWHWWYDDRRTGLDPFREVLPSLLDQLVATDPPVDGLFVAGDQYAAATHHLLAVRGRRPGRDVRLVTAGSDDKLVGLDPHPGLIDVGYDELGAVAARQLLWRLDHRREPERRVTLVPPRPCGDKRTQAADIRAAIRLAADLED
jgi:LacI family transcriptional regulator